MPAIVQTPPLQWRWAIVLQNGMHGKCRAPGQKPYHGTDLGFLMPPSQEFEAATLANSAKACYNGSTRSTARKRLAMMHRFMGQQSMFLTIHGLAETTDLDQVGTSALAHHFWYW